MSIYELLDKISLTPAMFFGEPTISRFESFLLGWMLESADAETERFISGFQLWIAERYGVRSSHSWASIIRFYSSDEVSALNNAFELIQEYRRTDNCQAM